MLNYPFGSLLLFFTFELRGHGKYLTWPLVGMLIQWITGGRWIITAVKAWGCSQKGGFLDLAEASIAVRDTAEPSLDCLLSWNSHLLYFFFTGHDEIFLKDRRALCVHCGFWRWCSASQPSGKGQSDWTESSDKLDSGRSWPRLPLFTLRSLVLLSGPESLQWWESLEGLE